MQTTSTKTTVAPAIIQSDIRAFIVENFMLGNDSGFDASESLLESGIIDSTGIMHVVAFLEERFGITVEDDDMVADNLESVQLIARFVESKMRRASAA